MIFGIGIQEIVPIIDYILVVIYEKNGDGCTSVIMWSIIWEDEFRVRFPTRLYRKVQKQ